ncbi:hypothetical protein Baya_4958 [Bagarius yarrelli]|uniref:Uncharacterized protein n=1 Tax=Bagarius yarrelli TaxID=175774 RepID=A0A556TRI1_BAGYA|nr:hypothetical protein Baya_4958 [Bagarius yarrelli]
MHGKFRGTGIRVHHSVSAYGLQHRSGYNSTKKQQQQVNAVFMVPGTLCNAPDLLASSRLLRLWLREQPVSSAKGGGNDRNARTLLDE